MGANDNKNAKVLIVDYDVGLLRSVARTLARDGYEVVAIDDPAAALALSTNATIDVVLSGVDIHTATGLGLVDAFRRSLPEVQIILMTTRPTLETAVTAMRLGVGDCLARPFASRCEELQLRLAHAVERRTAQRRAFEVVETDDELAGLSEPMAKVRRSIAELGSTQLALLLRGESGSGKSSVARAIHARGVRATGPFVEAHCGAPFSALLERELFGCAEKGPGARRPGLLERAEGGTIFLDEVGDFGAETQARLLRVLEHATSSRVGSAEAAKVDVRVIAATSGALERAHAEGRFRDDLYVRLNALALGLPALRDRSCDVPLLANRFMRTFARKTGRRVVGISPRAMALLVSNAWSGNVRALQNAMEHAVAVAQTELIDVDDLPTSVKTSAAGPIAESEVQRLTQLPFAEAKAAVVTAFERRYLAAMLARAGGNITMAARAAQLERLNFRRQMKGAGLSGA